MVTFSNTSRERLDTCHYNLKRLAWAVIKNGIDCTVVCGHRGEAEQDLAYNS